MEQPQTEQSNPHPSPPPTRALRWFDRASILLMVLAALIVVPRSMLISHAHSEYIDDEYHLLRGIRFWDGNLGKTPLNDPPIGAAIGALPAWLMGVKDHGSYASVIHRQQVKPETIMLWTAAWKGLLFVPTVWLIFVWGRALYGSLAGWMSAGLVLFEPTIAAHIPTPALDVLGMQGIVLACFCAWRLFERQSPWRFVGLCYATGLALLFKHTAIIVPGVVLLYALTHWIVARWWNRERVWISLSTWLKRVGLFILYGLGTLLAMWSIFLFQNDRAGVPRTWLVDGGKIDSIFLRISGPAPSSVLEDPDEAINRAALSDPAAETPPDDAINGSTTAPSTSPTTAAAKLATQSLSTQPSTAPSNMPTGTALKFSRLIKRVLQLKIPLGSYIGSLTQAIDHGEMGHNGYLWGEIRSHGWWYYFPVLSTYKVPIPLLALLALALASMLWKRPQFNEWPLLIAAIAWGLFVTKSGINIGFRHFLPSYIFLLMLACRTVATPTRWWIAILPIALVIASAVHSLMWHPNYLSYFNYPRYKPWLSVNDSNIDWGQNLKQIRAYIQSRPDWSRENIYVLHFGRTSPEENVNPATGNTWSFEYYLGDVATRRSRHQTPPLDGILIISPVWEAGIYDSRDRYRMLRDLRPHAIIGDSIPVYHLDRMNRNNNRWRRLVRDALGPRVVPEIPDLPPSTQPSDRGEED